MKVIDERRPSDRRQWPPTPGAAATVELVARRRRLPGAGARAHQNEHRSHLGSALAVTAAAATNRKLHSGREVKDEKREPPVVGQSTKAGRPFAKASFTSSFLLLFLIRLPLVVVAGMNKKERCSPRRFHLVDLLAVCWCPLL